MFVMYTFGLRFISSAFVYLNYGECIFLLLQSCLCIGFSSWHSSKMKVSKYSKVDKESTYREKCLSPSMARYYGIME